MDETPMMPVRVHLLGPVGVTSGERVTQIRGAKQRVLLAHLVLAEGRPVQVKRLIRDLWPDKRPKDPHHALQEHISRLRLSVHRTAGLVAGGSRVLPAGIELSM